MPYPGGKHGPGHYAAGVGGGGGSFFIDPFVLYDQVLETNMLGIFQALLSWNAADVTLKSKDDLGFLVSIDTLPLQFHTSRPGTPPGGSSTLSTRYIADFGPDAPIAEDFTGINNWITNAGNVGILLAAPGSPGTQENTRTYEMAFTADTSTIMARANITLRHVAP